MKKKLFWKKRSLLAAFCAFAMLAMSACGGADAPDTVDTKGPAGGMGSQTVSASGGKGGFGLSLSLDESGGLVINRSSTGSVPMGEDGTWTVFVYLCGTDLESNHGLATDDLLEMLEGSTGDDVRFVLQMGGTNEWWNETVDPSVLQRYEISEGELYLVDEQPGASMGDAGTLTEFLKWGVENYPAAKMGLIFWNHGGGSISGVCFDERYDNDSLSLSEIDSALAAAAESMTDRFEFIGFDACLMGTVETANILASYSRYMYGSEEIEPGYGWDYRAIGSYLAEHPGADGAELGRVVCDSFYDSCAEIASEAGATLSVIDLDKIDDVIVRFHDYVKGLYDASEENAVLSEVVRRVKDADNYGGNNKAEGYTNMVDLAGVVKAGAGHAAGAERVLSAIDAAVVYKRNGTDHAEACGLATYYPLQLQGSTELKTFGGVAVSPYYLAFVDRAVYGSVNAGTGNYDSGEVLDLWLEEGDGPGEYDEYWDDYGDCEPTGESPLIVFQDEPQLLEDGTFAFSLTDESLEYTAGVQANVLVISDDGEDLIELGVSVDIIADWENGVYMDNFDGYWFSLPDGQNLAVYVVDECEGYDVYASPVLLNGEETNLRLTHDYINGTVTIDGAWDGIDENGMASRNLYKLQPGDTITPLYYAEAIDSDDAYDYYGGEYVFDGEAEICFALLSDGEYLYCFTVDDIYGDYFITDVVNFTVDGEDIYYSELL